MSMLQSLDENVLETVVGGQGASLGGLAISSTQADALAMLQSTLEAALNATVTSSTIQADTNTAKQIAAGAAGR